MMIACIIVLVFDTVHLFSRRSFCLKSLFPLFFFSPVFGAWPWTIFCSVRYMGGRFVIL